MYNIWDVRGFGLPKAIRAVQLGNYNLMLILETNIPDEGYCHKRLGCNTVYTQAVAGGAQGGVGLVVKERLEGQSVK